MPGEQTWLGCLGGRDNIPIVCVFELVYAEEGGDIVQLKYKWYTMHNILQCQTRCTFFAPFKLKGMSSVKRSNSMNCYVSFYDCMHSQ